MLCQQIRQHRIRDLLGKLVDRFCGLLDIPLVLFGIALYLVDVGSDIAAAVLYFQEGHRVWGSLTITFVVASAICWATVNCIWWYTGDEDQSNRRMRMMLAVLLLDPLVRRFRLLWFTSRREYRKCRETGGRDVSEDERRTDPYYSDYWQKLVDNEESTAAFLSAIATLIEDAGEITLQLYIIIGHGVQENIIGYVQLFTSLAMIFYTTAQFPLQVRLEKPQEMQIKTFSIAMLALIVWRTLIVGSRILAFVFFASLFRHWLFVVVGCHYLLMFALVFYQLRFANHKIIKRVVYNIVTPLVYIFDFCVNWLKGPTTYWYVMCYVPMFCENVLMSGLVLWYASSTPSPAWYIVPGCVCVMMMFPLGVLVQLAYYRYWHPKVTPRVNPSRKETRVEPSETLLERNEQQSTQPKRYLTWSEFQDEVAERNKNPSQSTLRDLIELSTKLHHSLLVMSPFDPPKH